jgi:hypothetical protein
MAAFVTLAGIAPVHAQSPAPASTAYAYCQVEDTGNRQIWVSQVFPAPSSAGVLALDLATDFHAYVGTLGGAGNKQCIVSTREQAEATRAQVAQIMGKRVFGMRVYTWHDVQWTPNAAAYARTSPPPAVATQQSVYCRMTDTDTRTMVTTRVFRATFARGDAASHFVTLEGWAKAFGRDAAAAYRVAPDALCIASDTDAEAEKSLADYQHAFRFSGIKRIEMAWMPPPDPSPLVTRPSPGVSGDAAGATDAIEAELWRRVSTSTQAEDYKDYLAAYPQGTHAPIARLEARRLSGNGTKTAPDASAKTVPPVRAAAVSVPDGAVNEATGDAGATPLERRIATEAFFRIPPGDGTAVDRSGTRNVGTVSVASTLNTRRAAGNLCRMNSVSVAGGSVESRYAGQGWAGLLPVEGTLQSRSAYGSSDYTVQTTAIDALEGQPFPLREGSAFGYTFTQVTTATGGTPVTNVMDNRCVVGGTALAAALVPGLAGSATELTCTLSFHDANLPPQHHIVHWFDSTGCFVQDPAR